MSPNTPPPSGAGAEGRDDRKAGPAESESAEERKPTREEKAARIVDVLDGNMRWEYRVRHRRKGWRARSSNTEIIQTMKAAKRFVWKLQDADPSSKGELTELVIEKRLMGPWQHEYTIVEWDGGDQP